MDYQDIGSKIYDEDGNDLVSVSDKLDIANQKLDIANKKLEILQNKINIPKKQQEQEDSEIEMDEHICPKCKKASVKFHKDPSKRTKSEMQLVESIFGWRGSRIQSYCLECRSSKPKKVEIKTTPATSKTDSLYLECEKVIKYKRKNIDVKLVRQCLNLWINEKMRVKEIIKKLYWVDPKKVRRHIQTPERLPNNLKDNVSKYISDPDSIMAISYYVTDHFSWSGKKSDEEKVLKLGKKLAEGFAKNNDLRRKLMGKRN